MGKAKEATTTISTIIKRMEEHSKREEEIENSIREAEKKVMELSQEVEAALQSGDRNRFEKAKRDFSEAELDLTFSQNQQNEVPGITQEEKQEALENFLRDYNEEAEKARQRVRDAVSALREAMDGATALQNEGLRNAGFLSRLLGVDKYQILCRMVWEEYTEEGRFLLKAKKIPEATAYYYGTVNHGREIVKDRNGISLDLLNIREGMLSRPAVIK